jgi:queuine tRNA-ribosyltransferase
VKFELLAQDGNARRGVLHTAHGTIQTPVFMPVGTQATVKAMTPAMLEATGAEIILGNTYHLMLRPTAERVARLGGLHRFMNWQKPILTDSGGFQVMSLSGLRKLTEEGVTFQSHLDGSKHQLTPERAVEIQHLLDSNITMVLDECPAFPIEREAAAASMQRSMRWAKRCRTAFTIREGYGLFGIVQGSVFPELRQESAEALQEIGFDGYAIGGLAVGEGQDLKFEVLDYTLPHLPVTHPRYLMGVGTPEDIIGAVCRGVDMFDCVLPTRSGRNARAYTHHGVLNLRNARFNEDTSPVDSACDCYTCREFSRAYLHHLFKAGEMLAGILLTNHNLAFYQRITRRLREAISAGTLQETAKQMVAALQAEVK